MLIATMYINVSVTSLNNSGTAELHVMLLIVIIIMMYKTFKYSHGKEKYTEILPEHFKKALLQFRIGSHKLPVNNRKHFNVPRADIHCTHCDQSHMGMKFTFYMNVQS